MSAAEDVTVRIAKTTRDWEGVRALCCRTGDAGDPIEPSRWPFFAEAWIGPYQRLVPEWTYVADAGGRVVGYLTGCPSTEAFERARAFRLTVPLLLRIARGRYRWNADTRRFLRHALGLETGAEQRLRAALPATLHRDYPAHLHMNVDASCRRRGIGRRLLDRYVADLRASGVAGVHLVCGALPRDFYARLGFEELGRLELRPGVCVHALGRGFRVC